VVEASYAFDRPPLLKRLGDDKVPRIIDPQTLRFVGENFLEIERLSRLPYAPPQPIAAAGFDGKAARSLSRDALIYAQDRGADLHLAPALPLFDRDLDIWRQHNAALLAAACAANGGSELERRPLIAQVAPGNKALADPAPLVDVLLDHPVDGVYIQALRLQPTTDSLEKLARFVQFVRALDDAGLPVIVGRVGAFGLVLQSLGVSAFDSGLGQAESHDLASLNRRLTDRERTRRAEGGGGGPARRVYLRELMTTLPANAADAIVRDETLRHHFTCSLGCCRFRALEELGSRARIHYLHVRRAEIDRAAALPAAALRLHEVETQLRQAADLGERVRRALPRAGLPDFGHLERWLRLLAREQQTAAAA
jgi:hypothetical protein